MITIGSDDFGKMLDDLGSHYPLRIGSLSLDTVGEGSTTWTNTNGYGIFRPVNESMNVVKEGVLKIGDARFFCNPNAISTIIEAGSPVEIQFNGIWYKAEQPEIHKIGNDGIYEAGNLRRQI